jgi:LysR family transcriptional regulator, regulator for bpeEF and oprC
MDRFSAMHTFVAVAEYKSFSKAAEALGVPNASVSTRVAQLEAHLQAQLLSRTTRKVALTTDGASYFERAKRLLSELSELEAQVAGEVGSPTGRLRIDVPAAVARHVLGPALGEFFKIYPSIAVDMGSSDRAVDLVAEGVDCVIRGGEALDENLIGRTLGAFDIVTCAAPSYLKKHGVPGKLKDLETGRHWAVNFLSQKTDRAVPFEFEKKGQSHEILLPHRVSTNDGDSQRALCLEGLGLMQYPRTAALQRCLDTGTLVQVLKSFRSGEMKLFVLYPRNRHLSARVRVFVDWVVSVYQRQFSALNESVAQR